jgi:hypothetical protein
VIQDEATQESSLGSFQFRLSFFGPGLEACAEYRAQAFAEVGSLRDSVSSLELGLYIGPKRKGLVIALLAQIGDPNVARPAVLS